MGSSMDFYEKMWVFCGFSMVFLWFWGFLWFSFFFLGASLEL